MADPRALAAFVEGLPEGQRHRGFFWAAMTGTADGLDSAQMSTVAAAGLRAGLDAGYVTRTIAEARARNGEDDGH